MYKVDLNQSLINKMLILVEERIRYQLNIEKIAKELGYSSRHLRRIFKDETGINLSKYITYRKMTNALYDMKLNIYSNYNYISDKYGYDSYTSFLRSFIRVFKKSPSKIEEDFVIDLKSLFGINYPVIRSHRDSEYNLNRINFKDLYWKKNVEKIATHIIYCEEEYKLLTDELLTLGFGNHYVHNWNKIKNKPDIFDSVFNNPNCTKTNRYIVFIMCDDKDRLKIIKEQLYRESNINIIIDKFCINDIKATAKAIYRLVEQISNDGMTFFLHDKLNELYQNNKNIIISDIKFKPNQKKIIRKTIKKPLSGYLFIYKNEKTNTNLIKNRIESILKEDIKILDYQIINDSNPMKEDNILLIATKNNS